ncbi:PA3371 family protein [Azomonas macrocytogenes]|uniref:Cytochrome c biogenesis protein CcdA n=1 Tax=Azomonas macrocytogenes TaxID=69962 RepID=A0A839T667_AZOMA|nr:cytochrome c biogenesis protein CcdA [Azomonas macrocytogenes]
MSKTAIFSLFAILVCGAVAILSLESSFMNRLGCIGSIVFGIVFLLALLKGRKIKFDPILR